MTETRVGSRVHAGVSNPIGDRQLEAAMQAELDRLGPVKLDEAGPVFARVIQTALTEDAIAVSSRRCGVKPDPGKPLCDFVAPLDNPGTGGEGSTDVGEVRRAVPTVRAHVTTCAVGTPFYTWQAVAQGKAPATHKGMIHAAKVMAATAHRLIKNPAIPADTRAEHARHPERISFEFPILQDVPPPVVAPPAAE